MSLDPDEYVLRCMAVMAARKAAGLEPPNSEPGDSW